MTKKPPIYIAPLRIRVYKQSQDLGKRGALFDIVDPLRL